jgi:hypothetical protein
MYRYPWIFLIFCMLLTPVRCTTRCLASSTGGRHLPALHAPRLIWKRVIPGQVSIKRPWGHRLTRKMLTNDPEFQYGLDVWTHKLNSSEHHKGCPADVQWSADRRALAVYFCQGNDKNRLLVWRRGKRVRDWNGNSYLAGEPLYKMAWSPDDRRFLIHIPPAEGSWDLHTGPLWCIDMATGKHWLIYRPATYFSWIGSNTIRYRYKS